MNPEKYIPTDANDAAHVTTNSGAPVDDTLNSLTVGERGPVLLSDFHLVEKLANFDREVIPERRVHARGVAARGVFVCTHDITHLTLADPFAYVGKQTPVAVRFSTVVHSRHSPETLRDPRGFATKFYTQQGNWDLVGNLEPVFFIRDAMAFADMVHAFKPSPRTEKQEWHRMLDFLSFHPECLHMLTFLLDDVGIPKNYETMNGAGVHTFVMINAEGRETYVKFHWVTEQGVHNLMDDEAKRIGGEDFSHATTHLIETIESGRYPAWRLMIQTMDPETELDHDWGDPLDPTKTWPEDKFPPRPVGRMILNENMDNQFLQGECLAFSPGNVIPGITFSADKLLQGRIFSYADTQRYRLGANYLQLPINAPRCPFLNRQYDGTGAIMNRSKDVNYLPSAFERVQTSDENVGKMTIPNKRTVDGKVVRRALSKQNNFQQPGERWRSFDKDRRERFVIRVAETLNAPKVSKKLKSTWIEYWTRCDQDLGKRVAAKVKMSNM